MRTDLVDKIMQYEDGEKPGTKYYYRYGMQDFERMEGLNRGEWCFIGIQAKAQISYPLGPTKPGSRRLEHFTSCGLWGIESDGEYLNEVAKDELADLKNHLKHFGVDVSNFEELSKDLEIEFK